MLYDYHSGGLHPNAIRFELTESRRQAREGSGYTSAARRVTIAHQSVVFDSFLYTSMNMIF